MQESVSRRGREGGAGIGSLLGLAAAWKATPLLGSLLYGVRTFDLPVFTSAALLLIGVAGVSGLLQTVWFGAGTSTRPPGTLNLAAGFTVPDGVSRSARSCAAGPLRIVMGSKMGDVRVEFAGAPGQQISAAIYPEDSSRLGAGLERAQSSVGDGHTEFGALPPGRYLVFVTDCPNVKLSFRDQSVYQYPGVPAEVHGTILIATSKGSYFNRNIRGRFAYVRLSNAPS